MSSDLAKIGVIGLAVMGSNFARNLASRQIKTAVFNRTTEVTNEFIRLHGNEHIVASKTLEEFIASIEKPRKIILLVKAGSAVDAVIESLHPMLDTGDTIIDFGNSHYKNTQKRSESLSKLNLHYFGCGISGGEKGALEGPSLMPGGARETWQELRPIFEATAAKDFSGNPCVAYLGPNGAGNYVKTVHNGIEYGIMQILAESYQMLKRIYDVPDEQIAQIFDRFNQGKLNSFLLEMSIKVLNKKDEHTGDSLLSKILDRAAQKGTGAWTGTDALERGIPLPTITESVIARQVSSKKNLRVELNKVFPDEPPSVTTNQDDFIKNLESAIYSAKVLCFVQGMELIKNASTDENWDTNLAEVARIWQGGCIIRTHFLDLLEKELIREPKDNMMANKTIQSHLKANMAGLKKIVLTATKDDIAVPAFASAYNYFLGMTEENGPANLIQALRDGFGSHTYERTDQEGAFHTEWD
ncbi:NADP-dependent phosphogluconate dehydrogenase [Candidatus Peregrinibacteria bacterium]|nr:NADP-dependent phosphogluconate dehydrogenase [Candidatus Peregrinibacteria bacterium]